MPATLCIPSTGKRVVWASVAAAAPAYTSTGSLLYVTDHNSERNFLVDTGAQVSVLPASSTDISKATLSSTFQLRAANGGLIRAYGTRLVPLQINLKYYTWKFITANVPKPIIGADLLSQFDLLVNLNRKRLKDACFFPQKSVN